MSMRSFVLVEERLGDDWNDRRSSIWSDIFFFLPVFKPLTLSDLLHRHWKRPRGSTVRTCEDAPKRRCFGPLGFWGLRLRFRGPLLSPWCVSKSELNEDPTINAYQVSSESWSSLEHLPKQHLCLTWPFSSALIGAYIRSVRSHVAWVYE